MKHRISNLDYFFRVIGSKVKTVTLCEILDIYPNNVPIIVKLDTQDTELSILEGAKLLFENNRIIGIESEATLQAELCMQGSGKFWQLNAFLDEKGMDTIHHQIMVMQKVNECI
jgi:hypothetical protein